jgi:hypothetical protein
MRRPPGADGCRSGASRVFRCTTGPYRPVPELARSVESMDARSRASQQYVVPLSAIPWVTDGSLPRLVGSPYTLPSAEPVPARESVLESPVPAVEDNGRIVPAPAVGVEIHPPDPTTTPAPGLFDLPGLLGRIWMVSEAQHDQAARVDADPFLPGAEPSPPSQAGPAGSSIRAGSGDRPTVHRTTRWISLTITETQTDSPVATRMRAPLPVPHPEPGASSPARSGAFVPAGGVWICPGCRFTNAAWTVVCPVCHRPSSTGPAEAEASNGSASDPALSWRTVAPTPSRGA